MCQLHLELEENLNFSFVQHEVEEEEEREKAENIRWYVVKLHTSCVEMLVLLLSAWVFIYFLLQRRNINKANWEVQKVHVNSFEYNEQRSPKPM